MLPPLVDAAAVAAALRESGGVRVVGGGTKLGWGHPIEAPELSVAELDAIVEHNEGDLTAIVQAGVPLTAARKTFATRTPCSWESASMRARTCGSVVRGMTPSCTM